MKMRKVYDNDNNNNNNDDRQCTNFDQKRSLEPSATKFENKELPVYNEIILPLQKCHPKQDVLYEENMYWYYITMLKLFAPSIN